MMPTDLAAAAAPKHTAQPRPKARSLDPKSGADGSPSAGDHGAAKDPKSSKTTKAAKATAAGAGVGAFVGASANGSGKTGRATKPAGARDGAKQGVADLDDEPNYRNWLDQHANGRGTAAIAHRGNTEGGAAPNSIASLEAAAKDGRSDAVEMDISRLKDGTLVIYHDGDDLKIDDIEQLTKADLKDHPQIPTLEAWSKRAGELNVNVMAEFKGSGYEERALKVLQSNIGHSHLAAMSFDPDAVRAVHELDPRIPVALVPDRAADARSVDDQVDDLGFTPDYVEVADGDINETVISQMDARGIGVLAGKDDAAQQLALTRDDRVQGILSNKPSQAADLRDGNIGFNVFGALTPWWFATNRNPLRGDLGAEGHTARRVQERPAR